MPRPHRPAPARTQTLFALLLAACDPVAPPTPDAAPGADAGPSDDAGPLADAGPRDAAPPVDPALDEAVRAAMEASHLPGVSAAIVRDDRVAWVGTWGFADVAREVPVTPDTIFMLASVSKAVASLCAMHAVENGALGLDDAVGDVVPFTVSHPTSATPVTLRMLLTHTAGIVDDDAFIWSQYSYGRDADEPLGDYLRRYLDPSGADYDAAHWGAAPGTAWQYSNIGAALAGYVVERATSTDFADYCEANVFAPMGLVDTHWRLADVDVARTALPHEWNGTGFDSPGHYGYPDYPDGQLRSTASELAQILRLVMNGGEHDGTRILSAASVEELQRRQVPELRDTQALAWQWYDGGDTFFGHGGDDRGVATDASFRVRGNVGVVLLTNGTRDDRASFGAMELALYEYADRL